jgi:hypothetical protein
LETIFEDQSAEILSIIIFLTLMKENVSSRLEEEMFFECFGKDKQMSQSLGRTEYKLVLKLQLKVVICLFF